MLLKKVGEQFAQFDLAHKGLCVFEIVVGYLMPVAGIALGLFQKMRGVREAYTFCALSGAVAAMVVFAVEFASIAAGVRV